jgi:hypothetical protein
MAIMVDCFPSKIDEMLEHMLVNHSAYGNIKVVLVMFGDTIHGMVLSDDDVKLRMRH